MWTAKVSAKQGGPIYVHHFEGASVADLLEAINDGLDLSRATAVTIEMTPPDDTVEVTFNLPGEAPQVCNVERDRFAIMRAATKIAAERGPVKVGRVFPPEDDEAPAHGSAGDGMGSIGTSR